MKRKKWNFGTVIAFLVVMGVGIAIAASNDKKKEDVEHIDTENNMKQSKLEEYKAKVILTAYWFRLKASSQPNQAIKMFATPECSESWPNTITPMFEESEKQWGDFFCYALNFIGRVEENKAVIAFYNPWLDAVLLSEWSGPEKDLKMARFVICSGETWRSEPVDPNNPPLPKWRQGNKPLAQAVGRVFTEFARVFDAEYPVKDKFMFLVPNFKALAEKENQAKEIAITKKRMKLRAQRFKNFLAASPDSDTATMGILASKVRELIKLGNKAGLELMIKGKQNTAMLDLLFKSGAKYRRRLTYNSFFFKDKQGVVTLVNAIFPDGFIILNLSINGDQGQLDNIEAHKFEDFRNSI